MSKETVITIMGGHIKKTTNLLIENNIHFSILRYGQEFFKQNKGKATKTATFQINTFGAIENSLVERLINEYKLS